MVLWTRHVGTIEAMVVGIPGFSFPSGEDRKGRKGSAQLVSASFEGIWPDLAYFAIIAPKVA